MKISIKTLQGKQLPIEVEETDTIREVKQKIEATHQMQADLLKLIAYGKVMEDDNKLLKDYSIKEGDFLVVMVSKAKPPAKPKEDAKMEEPAAGQNQQQQQQQQPAQQQQQQPIPQAQQQQQQPAAGGIPPEMEAAVNELVMISGKSKEMCGAALRAAQGNPDVAFEILMQGIDPSQMEASYGQEGADDDYGEEGGDLGEGNPLAQLASNPNFQMIRQRIIQDPNFYQQFIQQLAQTQPQLFQIIQQNPGAFMNLILGGDPNVGMPGSGGHSHGAGPGQNPPGTISVSPEEMAAIDRLTQLGFPKARAAEAYFACDKNEEFAANYLFETGFEDDAEAMNQALAASEQQQQQQQQEQQPGQPGSGDQQQQQPPPNNDKKPDDDDSSLL